MVCAEQEEPGSPPTVSCITPLFSYPSSRERSVTECTLARRHLSCMTQDIWACFSNPKLNSYLLCKRNRKGKGVIQLKKKFWHLPSSLFLLSSWVKHKLHSLVKMPIRILVKKEYWPLDQVTQCSYKKCNASTFPPIPPNENTLVSAPLHQKKRDSRTGGGRLRVLGNGEGKAGLVCSCFLRKGRVWFLVREGL